jgi:hypothetical protein
MLVNNIPRLFYISLLNQQIYFLDYAQILIYNPSGTLAITLDRKRQDAINSTT